MLTGKPCGRCRADVVSDMAGCIRRVWREAIGTSDDPYLDHILRVARRQRACREPYVPAPAGPSGLIHGGGARTIHRCVADDEPEDDDGSAALRVMRKFIFVGVQSNWNLTVNAFAAQVGSPPVADDFVVSRAGWRPPNTKTWAARVARTKELFRAERRAYRADEAVVRAAEARLQRTNRRHHHVHDVVGIIR